MTDLEKVKIQNPETGETEMITRPRRARVFKKGRMYFENGLRSLPCTIRNISEGGALIRFDEPHLIPKEFELEIDLDGTAVPCERRWEDGLDCGVKFTGEVREVSKKSGQVLKTSENALSGQYTTRPASVANPYSSTSLSQAAPPAPEPAPMGQSFGKRTTTFGKRR